MKKDIFRIKALPKMESFKGKAPLRTKKSSKFIDARKTHYNHIVCADTGEIIKSYTAYLKSKHWKLFKKRFKESSYYRGRCFICHKEKNIHFHHLTYERIGKENLSDVIELCGLCHRNVHRAMNNNPKFSWDNLVKKMEEM